jgi:hypothetical protein
MGSHTLLSSMKVPWWLFANGTTLLFEQSDRRAGFLALLVPSARN